MILFRYLLKEVFVTLIALTVILLFIFISNQAVIYLNRAANGIIPGMIILKLLLCELPGLACALLPLGFYIAILLSYGRLYADHEMICMYTGGYSPLSLLKHTLLMALVVAVMIAWIGFKLVPDFAFQRAAILRTTGIKPIIQTLSPSQFKSISSDKLVFYVESVTRDHDHAQHVFLSRRLDDQVWQVIWADEAFARQNPRTGEDDLILTQGHAYVGVPQEQESQLIDFDEMVIQMPKPTSNPEEEISAQPTSVLWPFYGKDRAKSAELQWRLSVPIMVLVLTLIAVPLSHIRPRAGKFSHLLVAIGIYMIYANLMFVARDWMVNGTIPIFVGIIWVHMIFLCLGLGLIWRDARGC